MGVHLPNAKLSYFSAPKCASTSVKRLFFELENGRAFEEYTLNGVTHHVHKAYPTRKFDAELKHTDPDNWTCAIVRDPVKRFLSAYGNRVIDLNELDAIDIPTDLRAKGVTPTPDLPTYVRFFREYRSLSLSIKWHTIPLVWFLGTDATFYDRIYQISELSQMAKDMRRKTGGSATLEHRQNGEAKFSRSDLSAAEVKKIEDFYESDFAAFGDAF